MFLSTDHFLILISSWWICCCHCTWTTFSIPWWLLMFWGRWNWNGIDRTGITITIAVILSSSTVTRCPNVDNTFTITAFCDSFDKSCWCKCTRTFDLNSQHFQSKLLSFDFQILSYCSSIIIWSPWSRVDIDIFMIECNSFSFNTIRNMTI